MIGADRDPNIGISLLTFTGASGSSEAAPCRGSGDKSQESQIPLDVVHG